MTRSPYATSNTADATFTSTDINYGDASTNWAIGSLADFLNADAGSIDPASTATDYFQESVLQLTGLVSLNNGDSLSVTSDDGFRLLIDGANVLEFVTVRAPGNTTSGTWTGLSGTYSATLWYFECQETQARLISNLGTYAVAAVPLPGGMILLLTAVGGVGVLRKRRAA